jgi:hypothetical protein
MSELAIRLRRAAFNRALAEGDLAFIQTIFAPHAVVVTGTESIVRPNRKAQIEAWRQSFATPDRVIYTRLPDTITLSPIEPIALEQGHWQGVRATTAAPFASGSYTAKWRATAAEWMIEAELYLTLA